MTGVPRRRGASRTPGSERGSTSLRRHPSTPSVGDTTPSPTEPGFNLLTRSARPRPRHRGVVGPGRTPRRHFFPPVLVPTESQGNRVPRRLNTPSQVRRWVSFRGRVTLWETDVPRPSPGPTLGTGILCPIRVVFRVADGGDAVDPVSTPTEE